MPRILAYPFVALTAFAVSITLIILVWSAVEGEIRSVKEVGPFVLMISFWSWAGIDVYRRYIKRPREEKKLMCAEATQVLEKAIAPDSGLGAAIDEVRSRFALVGEPRHRSALDPAFDTTVELETEAFIISLFSRDGRVKAWSVR